jgi:hypothetical protein
MKPARYINDPDQFTGLRDALNEALAFSGVRVNEQGVLVRGGVAKTLSEPRS